MFRTLNKNNTCNQVFIQGSRAQDSVDDIASIIFQNYDLDTNTTYDMAAVAMMDAYGDSSNNGMGSLVIKTNTDGLYPTEKVRIDNFGNVSIGTTQSLERLTINGGISAPYANLQTLCNANIYSSNITTNYHTFPFVSSSNVSGSESNIVIFADSNDGKLKYVDPSNTIRYINGTDIVPVYYIESTSLSLSLSQNLFIEKCKLETPIIPAGTYSVFVSYQLFNSSSSTAPIRITSSINDTVWMDCINCSKVINGVVSSSIEQAFNQFSTFTDSSNVIDLKYSSPNGKLVGLSNSRITLFRSTQPVAVYYTESSSIMITSQLELTEKLRISTPILTAGKYRIMTSFQTVNGSSLSSVLRVVSWLNSRENIWMDTTLVCPATLCEKISGDFTNYEITSSQFLTVGLELSSINGNFVGIKNAKIEVVRY